MSRHPTARRAVACRGPLRHERLAAVLARHRLAHGLRPLLSPSSVVALAARVLEGRCALRAAEVQPGRPAVNPQRRGREGERRGPDELARLGPASVAAEVVVHEHGCNASAVGEAAPGRDSSRNRERRQDEPLASCQFVATRMRFRLLSGKPAPSLRTPGSQPHRPAADPRLAPHSVDEDLAHPQRSGAAGLAPAQDRPDPGDDLLDRERLDDVVFVRAVPCWPRGRGYSATPSRLPSTGGVTGGAGGTRSKRKESHGHGAIPLPL